MVQPSKTKAGAIFVGNNDRARAIAFGENVPINIRGKNLKGIRDDMHKKRKAQTALPLSELDKQ